MTFQVFHDLYEPCYRVKACDVTKSHICVIMGLVGIIQKEQDEKSSPLPKQFFKSYEQ